MCGPFVLSRGRLHILATSRRVSCLLSLSLPHSYPLPFITNLNSLFAMFFPVFCAALLLSTGLASPGLFPRIVSQERATYNGGWALGLPSPGCPADAPVSCQDSSGDINPTCCPFGQTCFGFETPYCCPTGTFTPHPQTPSSLNSARILNLNLNADEFLLANRPRLRKRSQQPPRLRQRHLAPVPTLLDRLRLLRARPGRHEPHLRPSRHLRVRGPTGGHVAPRDPCVPNRRPAYHHRP